MTEAQTPWAELPRELLIAVVAAAAPHACSLPELLAPARVCRSWSLAYRDDELWRAVHASLRLNAEASAGDAPAAASPAPSWRERVISATSGLSLVDRGVGPGAVELPLVEAVQAGSRILRNSVCAPAAGGHVCVLNRGRLTVVHLSGPRGVTPVLHSVRVLARPRMRCSR